MSFYIESPAILAPGLDGWSETKAILRGKSPYQATPLSKPVVSIIPENIQRRCSSSALLAAHVAEQTLNASQQSMNDFNAVFASSVGDPEIDHKLCLSVAAEKPLPSAILFHNSVHNAPASYWSIAMQSQSHNTSLAAGEASFVAGLLSAYTQITIENRPVMLVAYDQPLQGSMSCSHSPDNTFACSLLLTPEKTDNSLIKCELELRGIDKIAVVQGKNKNLTELTKLYRTVPAAQVLPLFALLAKPENRTLTINCNDDLEISLACLSI